MQSVLHVGPVLFPELVDNVMGYIHHDKDTLKSCSLTCRLWLWASRGHLFHSISIHGTRFTTFERFIYASPDIVRLIRTLQIGTDDWKNEDGIFMPPVQGLTLAGILNAVAALPNLRDLLLYTDFTGWECPPFGLEEGLLPNTVSTLFMRNVQFNSYEDLAYFLSYFHHLKRLKVRFLDSRSSVSQSFTTDLLESCWHAGLESININPYDEEMDFGFVIGPPTQFIIDLLLHGSPPRALQSARFHVVYTWDDIAAIGRLHASIGPSLRHLRFDISLLRVDVEDLDDRNEAWRHAWVPFHIDLCTNLETLHVYRIQADMWEAISTLFQVISSPFLSHLVLTCMMTRVEDETEIRLESLDWSHVKRSLQSLHALTKIEIELCCGRSTAKERGVHKGAALAALGELTAEIYVQVTW